MIVALGTSKQFVISFVGCWCFSIESARSTGYLSFLRTRIFDFAKAKDLVHPPGTLLPASTPICVAKILTPRAKLQNIVHSHHFSCHWGASPAQPSFWRQSEAEWRWKQLCQNRGSWRWAKMWCTTHGLSMCQLRCWPSAGVQWQLGGLRL